MNINEHSPKDFFSLMLLTILLKRTNFFEAYQETFRTLFSGDGSSLELTGFEYNIENKVDNIANLFKQLSCELSFKFKSYDKQTETFIHRIPLSIVHIDNNFTKEQINTIPDFGAILRSVDAQTF